MPPMKGPNAGPIHALALTKHVQQGEGSSKSYYTNKCSAQEPAHSCCALCRSIYVSYTRGANDEESCPLKGGKDTKYEESSQVRTRSGSNGEPKEQNCTRKTCLQKNSMISLIEICLGRHCLPKTSK